MEDALSRIAALAPSLKEAELRCLIELTRRAGNEKQVRCSSRELARAMQVSRPNVQAAIDSLTNRELITTDGGSATKASSYKLTYLETAVLPERGSFTEPQVALFQSQGGIVTEPGSGFATEPHPRARVAPGSESDLDWDRRIRASSDLYDRIAKASPESYDSDEIRIVREALCGYWRRMRSEPDAHPPPPKICAEMLAIAPKRRIQQLIEELWKERQKPDSSYRWFITVALNRIHHIEPATIRKGFADLRILEKHVPDPVQRDLLPDDDKERMLALHEQVKRMAGGKAFR